MTNRTTPIKTLLLTFCSLALFACSGNPTTPTNLIWQPDTQAKIITQVGLQAECIAPVSVYEINGQTTTVSQQGFFLEGGQHKIKAQGLVSTFGCPAVYIPRNYVTPPIEANFEAGKVYYLGMDHNPRSIRDWRVIIWKVEDRNGNAIPLDQLDVAPEDEEDLRIAQR
ncbi:MAG: hypothetical protein AAGH19_02345 [Pseudomonadota bacterium]